MKKLKLSRHGQKRGRERIGLNLSALEKLADKALKEGITQADVKGKVNRFLGHLFLKYPDNHAVPRIYGEHIYLFAGTTLVTILPLPNEYKNYKLYLKAKT